MKYRHTMMLLVLSLPICVMLRAIQLIFTIDNDTGFIKQQYTEISMLITLIVCAAVVAIYLLAATTNDTQSNPIGLHPAVAIACALTGGMFIFETASSLSTLNMGAWHDIVLVILNLLSAIAFLAYGLRNVFEYKFPSVILVVPVVYYIVKLINLFVSTSALSLVTENVFLLFANSALLWFVFEFASYENGIGDMAKKAKRLFACGITAIMMCAITALPKLILLFSQKGEVLRGDISSALLMISLALFVFVYVVCNFAPKDNKTAKIASKHSA